MTFKCRQLGHIIRVERNGDLLNYDSLFIIVQPLFLLHSFGTVDQTPFLIVSNSKNMHIFYLKMCHNITEVFRCGRHTGRTINYCRRARVVNGRRVMCSQRSHTRSNQRDAVCTNRNCRHRQLGGVWTCCLCDYGPNRYGQCSAGRCYHRPCDECTPYRRR